jgi:hypothetical protein
VKLLPWPNIFHQRLIIKDIALESTGNISLANRHMAFAVRSLQGGQPACSRTSMGLAVSSDVKTIQNQQNIQKKSKKQTTSASQIFSYQTPSPLKAAAHAR